MWTYKGHSSCNIRCAMSSTYACVYVRERERARRRERGEHAAAATFAAPCPAPMCVCVCVYACALAYTIAYWPCAPRPLTQWARDGVRAHTHIHTHAPNLARAEGLRACVSILLIHLFTCSYHVFMPAPTASRGQHYQPAQPLFSSQMWKKNYYFLKKKHYTCAHSESGPVLLNSSASFFFLNVKKKFKILFQKKLYLRPQRVRPSIVKQLSL